jgi:hypothetical protein
MNIQQVNGDTVPSLDFSGTETGELISPRYNATTCDGFPTNVSPITKFKRVTVKQVNGQDVQSSDGFSI